MRNSIESKGLGPNNWSLGIRIPNIYLKSLNIKNNDKLSIEQQEDKIILTKSKKEKISLAERFKEYKGNYKTEEFWDDPVGEEIW